MSVVYFFLGGWWSEGGTPRVVNFTSVGTLHNEFVYMGIPT